MTENCEAIIEIRKLASELDGVLTRLDALGQDIAAAHVQAGLDALRALIDTPSRRPPLP